MQKALAKAFLEGHAKRLLCEKYFDIKDFLKPFRRACKRL
jgi:hypothetical protein